MHATNLWHHMSPSKVASYLSESSWASMNAVPTELSIKLLLLDFCNAGVTAHLKHLVTFECFQSVLCACKTRQISALETKALVTLATCQANQGCQGPQGDHSPSRRHHHGSIPISLPHQDLYGHVRLKSSASRMPRSPGIGLELPKASSLAAICCCISIARCCAVLPSASRT